MWTLTTMQGWWLSFSRHVVKAGVSFNRLSVIMLRPDGRYKMGKKGRHTEMDICDHESIKDM